MAGVTSGNEVVPMQVNSSGQIILASGGGSSGADLPASGTGFLVDADGATTQTGDVLGVHVDADTDYTPVGGNDIVLYRATTPTHTYTTAGATEVIGYEVIGNAITANNAGLLLDWIGFDIVMPSMTVSAGTAVTAGIRVVGSSTAQGTYAGLSVQMNQATHTAILVPTGVVSIGNELRYSAEQSGDPSVGTNQGATYTKDVSGVTELFFNSDGGAVQITSGGAVNGSGGSLDDAYNNGRTITVDAGAVVLNMTQTTGTMLDLRPGAGITATGAITSIQADYRTNLTGAAGSNFTGYMLGTPAMTDGTGSLTTYEGIEIQGGALQASNAAGGQSITWLGMTVSMPSVTNNSLGGETLVTYGIQILGNATADGTYYGVRIAMDDDADTAIRVDSGTTYTSHLRPISNDNKSLGASGAGWQDLWLGANAPIRWDGTAVQIAHASGSDTIQFSDASGGYVFDYNIEVNLGTFASGTALDIAYGSAEVQTGNLVGLNIDFDTNLTAALGNNITGIEMDIVNQSFTSAGTSIFRGMSMAASAVTVNNASADVIWAGGDIVMPAAVNTSSTNFDVYGLRIIGNALAGGDSYSGLFIDMDAPEDTAISGTGIISMAGGGAGNAVVTAIGGSNLIDFTLVGYPGGTIIEASYSIGDTITSDLNGVDFNFNGSVTWTDGVDLRGFRLSTPAVTQTSAATTVIRGFAIETAGALDTTTVGASNIITWAGGYIQMPAVDASIASSSVSAYGIHIIGGAVTDGSGTENVAGVFINMNADGDKAIEVNQGWMDLDGAMTHALRTITSADATFDDGDHVVIFDTGATARTANLPAASGNAGRIYRVLKKDSGAGSVDIDPNGAETINGSTTFSLNNQYDAATIVCDGTEWFVV